MAGTKHTPGPWAHGVDDTPPDCSIESEGGGCVAHVQCHANINTVARTGEEFSHADARLIAAAPDLLAACERFAACVHSLTRDLTFLGPQLQQTGVIANVLAAIAKARGNQTGKESP